MGLRKSGNNDNNNNNNALSLSGNGRMWRYDGKKMKVQLHLEDGWGEAAPKSYWIITPDWFRSNKATITEVVGSKKRTTRGKMTVRSNQTFLRFQGIFKKSNYPFFTMTLSSDVSTEDSNSGYLMAGEVERSAKKKSGYQTTHLAFVSRASRSTQGTSEDSNSSSSPNNNNNSRSSSNKRIFTLATNYFKNLFRNYARL